MNDLLKAKYYEFIKNKNFDNYEIAGKVFAEIEDKLIKSNGTIEKETLVNLIFPIKEIGIDLYNEMMKDINCLIMVGSNNE